jgi:hypothetical protein
MMTHDNVTKFPGEAPAPEAKDAIEDEATQYDWAAIQERLALLLYQMAEKVIGEKIKVDPLAADSAIRYCLSRVARGPYNPAREEHFWNFVLRCGGSLEWVAEGDVTPLIIQYAAARPPPQPYRGDIYEVDTAEMNDEEYEKA